MCSLKLVFGIYSFSRKLDFGLDYLTETLSREFQAYAKPKPRNWLTNIHEILREPFTNISVKQGSRMNKAF